MNGARVLIPLACGGLLRMASANPCPDEVPATQFCTLDDVAAVADAGGELNCGSFVQGMNGMAFQGSAGEPTCLRLPADRYAEFPWSNGVLDFWFKLEGFTGPLPHGDAPAMVRLTDGQSRYGLRVGIDMTSQYSGLLGEAGTGMICASDTSSALSFEDVMPDNGLADWHHAALFWSSWGLPVEGDPVLTLFIDGLPNSTAYSPPTGSFPPLDGAWLEVAVNEGLQGHCLIDELRVFPINSPRWANEIALALMSTTGPFYFVCVQAVEPTERFSLNQNAPNPFNPTTEITFTLPERRHVNLEVFDLRGRRVLTLLDGTGEEGANTVRFDGASLPSGVYVYRLEAGSLHETRAMTLVK